MMRSEFREEKFSPKKLLRTPPNESTSFCCMQNDRFKLTDGRRVITAHGKVLYAFVLLIWMVVVMLIEQKFSFAAARWNAINHSEFKFLMRLRSLLPFQMTSGRARWTCKKTLVESLHASERMDLIYEIMIAGTTGPHRPCRNPRTWRQTRSARRSWNDRRARKDDLQSLRFIVLISQMKSLLRDSPDHKERREMLAPWANP